MTKQYIISEKEIKALKDKLRELKQAALLSRDVGSKEDNREFYLMAKGLQIAMDILKID